jgi:thiosulfate/3-mercaptopyruvate sulfurtransferase
MIKKSGLLAFIICVIFFLGFTGIVLAAGGKELDIEKSAVTFAREVERGSYKIVTTQELKSWIDQKKDMLIVDNNPYDVFKKQHYPGAVHFELPRPEMTTLDDKTRAGLEKVLGPDKNRVIIFYCGFTECTRSHNGAMWGTRLGYKNAYRQPGGIRAWNEAEYPFEKVQ